jgi:RNA polymerase sigma-70 factor (ECF subfamily)
MPGKSARPNDADEDARLLGGSAVDFGQFYERHERFVLSIFLRQRTSAEAAADLAAETFARALAGRRRFEPSRGAPRAWLAGIARHVLIESLRAGRTQDRVRRRLRVERLELDDAAIERINELADEKALAALDELPEDQRIAVRGRVVDEHEYDLLASRLRCSDSVVRKRVSRGIEAMRARLEQERT